MAKKTNLQITDLRPRIENYILKKLESDLIPLALEVLKGEMLQSTDTNLRHKAAEQIIGTYNTLKGEQSPSKKPPPLVNFNFPEGYLERTFNGMTNLINKGVKKDAPRTIKELAEEDYL